MGWTRHFLCIIGVILTLSSSALSQDESDSGAAAASFNNDNNGGNQQVDAFTTPTTVKQTTLPNLPPATTPVEVNRTTVPTNKVVPFIPTVPAQVSNVPTGNVVRQTNPPTKPPKVQGGGKDINEDEDDDNTITKDAAAGDGASHVQVGGMLLALSVTVGNLLRQWTSV